MPPFSGFPLSTSRVRPSADARVRRGFALLITIVLVAFLVLILVGLATFVRVETQVADNSQQLAKARQNALFALNVAVGRLQREAGPDQRVTATAEVLATTDPTKRKWTGVWDTRTANLSNPPVWLVSRASDAAADQPRNDTAAPTLPAGMDADASAVRLVGDNTVDTTTAGNGIIVPVESIRAQSFPGLADDPAGHVLGRFGYWVGDEGVKARVNLSDPLAGNSDDISLETRAGLAQRTAWELFGLPSSASGGSTEYIDHLITETITNAQDRALSPNQLGFLAGVDAAAPAAAADALRRLTTDRYHDFTLSSAGVQADVRNGGLKIDLSTAFDLPDANFDASEFGSLAPIRNDTANQQFTPIQSFSPPGGVSAPQVSFVFNPRVNYNKGGTNVDRFLRGPTWHLLRSHHLLYRRSGSSPDDPGSVPARAVYPGGRRAALGDGDNIPSLYQVNAGYVGGQTDPSLNTLINGSTRRVPRPTETGTAPYINRIFIRFGVKTVPRTVTNANGDSASVWAVQLVMTPFVVLHNPYDAEVRFSNFANTVSPGPGGTPNIAAQINLFAGTGFGLPLFTRVFINGVDAMGTATNTQGVALMGIGTSSYGSAPRFRLLIPSSVTLEPGELKVLYPQSSDSDVVITRPGSGDPDPTFVTMDITPNLKGGYVFPYLNGMRQSFHWSGRYNAVKNTVTDFNPPVLTQAGDAPEATKALTDAEFAAQVVANSAGNFAELWANSATDRIEVVMNTISADLEMKYSVESVTDDDAATGSTDLASMAYQLSGYAPDYVGSGSPNGRDAYLAQYTRYQKPGSGFARADDYRRPDGGIAAGSAGTTQYFFGMDYYVKAANHSADRAARPFVTSNPVALNQYHTALGDQSRAGSSDGTSGFPRIMPAYQLEFVDLDPNTAGSLQDNMYISSSGNAVWGPHNGIDGQATGSGLGGDAVGFDHVPLIKIPQRPLYSLAEFQHANIGLYGYQPYFAAGNSYASPYVPPNSAVNPVGYQGDVSRPYFLTDLSYFLNDALWDKYFFSSLSQEHVGGSWRSSLTDLRGSISTWASGTRIAPNSRLVPHNSARATAADNIAANNASVETAYRQVAASSLMLGGFNVNSQSVDAWAAVLGAARGADMVKRSHSPAGNTTLPITGDIQSDAATPIPRVSPTPGARADSDALSEETWTGFAALTDDQIRQLAQNIVAGIRRRQHGTTYNHQGVTAPARTSYTGPFRSLADFINRNLADDLSDGINSTAARGVLQAALDGIHADSPNRRFFQGSAYQDVSDAQNDSKWRVDWGSGTSDEHRSGAGPTASSASGFLLQADLLQQIGPFLSARSDTFTIRTYGESVNPVNGESQGRAWCEAIVQRLPEYVDQSDPALNAPPAAAASRLAVALHDATPPYAVDASGNVTPNVNLTNQTFGRRFRIVGFRWLSPNDL